MSKRIRTIYKGVYQRESTEMIFKGKPNLCFDIAYKKDGKLIWEKIGWLSEGYSAKMASDLRSGRMKQIRHGEELPKEKQKEPFMKDAWDKYYAWAQESKTRAARDDKNLYHKHIEPSLSTKRLNEISGFDLERLKADLSKQGLADATVKHVLVLIRQIYNKSILWGFYKGTKPLSGVKMPVPQNQRERWLTTEEANLLLARLKERSPLWHDITLIALHTGMRASEIFALRGHDLDFEQETINIDDTKNKHSRKAFMTTPVKEILEKRKPQSPGDLVFTKKPKAVKPETGSTQAQEKEPITEVSRTFDRTVEKLGFNKGITDPRQKVVFHTTRHTFASWLAIQGTPLHVIAELTGHRQMAMVQRYSHLSPDVKRKAMKLMEAKFKSQKEEHATNTDMAVKA
jgi:integrase